MIRALMAPSELAQRLLAGDRRALARAITLVRTTTRPARQLVAEVYPHTGAAAVVGVTGPPGAGKSTLIGALTARRRAAGRRVGVLSVDPTSPFTGGAVLGDRIRLAEHFLDPGVFIRSMATRGALGGLADAALQATLLIDAAGHEDIYLETVGVGQAEVDVVAHADTVVLVLVPGSGDSVQALKAGMMEIPDVIVVNKAAQGPAAAMVRDIRGVLSLAPAGAPEVAGARDRRARGHRDRRARGRARGPTRARIEADGTLLERRRRNLRNEVLSIAGARWRRALEARLEGDAGFDSLLDEVVARRLDPAAAARALESREWTPLSTTAARGVRSAAPTRSRRSRRPCCRRARWRARGRGPRGRRGRFGPPSCASATRARARRADPAHGGRRRGAAPAAPSRSRTAGSPRSCRAGGCAAPCPRAGRRGRAARPAPRPAFPARCRACGAAASARGRSPRPAPWDSAAAQRPQDAREQTRRRRRRRVVREVSGARTVRAAAGLAVDPHASRVLVEDDLLALSAILLLAPPEHLFAVAHRELTVSRGSALGVIEPASSTSSRTPKPDPPLSA